MIKIQAFKYGNRLHYEWETQLLEQTDTHIVVVGQAGRKLRHYTRGQTFTMDNLSIEFFPVDRWFTVSAEVVGGKIVQYYCNINEPARMEDRTVSFIDLDIDLIWRDGTWRVVDEDEFAVHSVQFAYPPELIARVKQEQASLQRRIAQKQFPFDGSFDRFLKSAAQLCNL